MTLLIQRRWWLQVKTVWIGESYMLFNGVQTRSHVRLQWVPGVWSHNQKCPHGYNVQSAWTVAVGIQHNAKLRTRPITMTEREQKAQLSPRDRAMRCVSWNLANCHTTVQKLLIQQVLTKSMVWSWRFSWKQCVINMCTQPRRDRVALIVS